MDGGKLYELKIKDSLGKTSPSSVFLDHCVLGQDTSNTPPTGGGQRAGCCKCLASHAAEALFLSVCPRAAVVSRFTYTSKSSF